MCNSYTHSSNSLKIFSVLVLPREIQPSFLSCFRWFRGRKESFDDLCRERCLVSGDMSVFQIGTCMLNVTAWALLVCGEYLVA